MKKVVTCSQMKLLDHGTIHNMHVPSLVLMERAALATAEEIRKYLEKKNGSALSFCIFITPHRISCFF